jgi:hypothetical protein
MQTAHNFGLTMKQCIFGDVEPERLDARTGFHEVFDEEPFSAADV